MYKIDTHNEPVYISAKESNFTFLISMDQNTFKTITRNITQNNKTKVS